jgi:hypothetical protein
MASNQNYCDGGISTPEECENDDFEPGFFSYRKSWCSLIRAGNTADIALRPLEKPLHNLSDFNYPWIDFQDGAKVSFGPSGSESHEFGEYDAYDADVRAVYIKVFGFAEASDEEGEDPSTVQPGNLRCLRAVPEDGSRTLHAAGSKLVPGLMVGLVVLVSSVLVSM